MSRPQKAAPRREWQAEPLEQAIHVNDPLPARAPSQVTLSAPIELDDVKIRRLLDSEPLPVVHGRGKTPEERILSILLDDRMRLGPRELITLDRDMWLGRIRHFTRADEPIQFVLMALAFKSPSTAKTDRVGMDLGELLMMRRWVHLATLIRSVYAPGAIVNPMVEGILGRCTGQDPQRVERYERSLSSITELLDDEAGSVRPHDLGEIVRAVDGFDGRWQARAEEIRARLDAGDPGTVRTAASVIPSIRTAVPVLDHPEDTVLRALAEGSASDSPEVRALAAHIDSAGRVAFCRYLAFLQLRDETHYLERVVPGALKLTVSVKRGNIGSIPINARTHTLPYHGVPVRLPSGRWSIRYLVEVRASAHRYQPVHRVGDRDPAPFAYLATR